MAESKSKPTKEETSPKYGEGAYGERTKEIPVEQKEEKSVEPERTSGGFGRERLAYQEQDQSGTAYREENSPGRPVGWASQRESTPGPQGAYAPYRQQYGAGYMGESSPYYRSGRYESAPYRSQQEYEPPYQAGRQGAYPPAPGYAPRSERARYRSQDWGASPYEERRSYEPRYDEERREAYRRGAYPGERRYEPRYRGDGWREEEHERYSRGNGRSGYNPRYGGYARPEEYRGSPYYGESDYSRRGRAGEYGAAFRGEEYGYGSEAERRTNQDSEWGVREYYDEEPGAYRGSQGYGGGYVDYSRRSRGGGYIGGSGMRGITDYDYDRE